MPKKTLILLIGAFTAGILFAGAGAVVIKKAIPLMRKVKKKIEMHRIANIPKAKKIKIISDFENERDIRKWDLVSASAVLSNEHATSGKRSLKVTFKPAQLSSVKIEEYLKKHEKSGDWSRYELLKFDIFNPSRRAERMILQIRDNDGYKIKRNLYLKAKKNNTFEVDIRGLWENIKVDRIKQFNLFLWNNKSDKVFYLDNVALLPSATMGKKGKSIVDSEYVPKNGEEIYKTGAFHAC